MSSGIERAIQRGIAFLANDQQADGSFLCLVSSEYDVYDHANVVPAIVPTNIVLSSLARIPEDERTQRIKQRAATFLLQEKSDHWSYNYWFRRSDWFVKEPYPDDLDDTFCALAALHEYDASLFDGAALAKIAVMLTSAEVEEGGPYDMWLVPPSGRTRWKDTDLVVNSNIGYFLSLQGVHLPKLTAFIEASIDRESYAFPYNSIYPGIYFIARWYKGPKTIVMIDRLRANQESNGGWENPLRTALAATALMNLSEMTHRVEIERAIATLIGSQEEDGSWKPFSFYYQMKTPEKTLFAGSRSITTALCIESLERFRSLVASSSATASTNSSDLSDAPQKDEMSLIAEQIRQRIDKRMSACGPDVQHEAREMCHSLLHGDLGKQILLLPALFRLSLGANGKNISDDLVIRLGVANACGWIAYTIYDDVFDEEANPHQLSLANICHRESFVLFRDALSYQNGFAELASRVFDGIDIANAWEVNHAHASSSRLPDYGDLMQLAYRSFGHALGPIAILHELGYHADSFEVQSIRHFFEHFLIARQLDDDAHDWQEDLEHGRLNAVVVWITQDAYLDLATLRETSMEVLKKMFWETTVLRVCAEIEIHLAQARSAIESLSFIQEPQMLLSALGPIETSIAKARRERADALVFFETYQAATSPSAADPF